MVRTSERTNVDASALQELATGFRGEIVLPDSPSYERRARSGTGPSIAIRRS